MRHFNPRSPHGERRCASSSTAFVPCYFNPRSPHGERLLKPVIRGQNFQFQSTLPARGATAVERFYALSPAFQSTLPARGATFRASRGTSEVGNFNPRSPHGERLGGCSTTKSRGLLFQSTLPARGATPESGKRVRTIRISIHAPRTGSDIRDSRSTGERSPFQSTLPARGATTRWSGFMRCHQHFNPRSPHGERR